MSSRIFCVCIFLLIQINFANAGLLDCNNVTLEKIQKKQKEKGYSDSSLSQWFEVENPKAVALVIHGINAKPKIMQPLVKWLNSKKISAFRITMAGHGENMQEFYNVSRKKWLSQVHDSYCIVDQRAQGNNLKKIFIGYSFGALIFSDFYTKYDNAHVDKMALFAPPFELTFFASAVRVMFWVNKLVIPSLANIGGYRAHWGVPVSAYKALFHSREALELANKEKLKKTPAIVIIDQDDELVSYSLLKKWMTKRKMFEWEFFEVDNSMRPLKLTYDHMITEENFLGTLEWNRLLAKLTYYFHKKDSKLIYR